MRYSFTVLIERGEDDAYIATAPSLKDCCTQADTLPELLKKIREVIEPRLDSANEQRAVEAPCLAFR